jgi:cyclic pyranopterin monophosphate synthase
MAKLSHLNEDGTAHMVDIGGKEPTRREAIAEAVVCVSAQTLELAVEGQMKKGDVFGAARIAGIMAAKKTPELIPLCHPLPIDSVEIDFRVDQDINKIFITATAATTAKTGVEMEAMTAAATAALVIYDMCKAAEKGIVIESVQLIRKTGGKSGVWER